MVGTRAKIHYPTCHQVNINVKVSMLMLSTRSMPTSFVRCTKKGSRFLDAVGAHRIFWLVSHRLCDTSKKRSASYKHICYVACIGQEICRHEVFIYFLNMVLDLGYGGRGGPHAVLKKATRGKPRPAHAHVWETKHKRGVRAAQQKAQKTRFVCNLVSSWWCPGDVLIIFDNNVLVSC